MELFDLYDETRRATGETMVRGTPTPEGRYRLVVHVCIFNSRGELLIQQRQPFKSTWGGMWDLTVGGGVVSGETTQTAGEREVSEEIGYDLSLQGAAPAMSVTFPEGFDDYYIVEFDLDISRLRFQPEEVKTVKWASLADVLSMINSGEFIPYHKAFIEFLFFRRNGSGTRTM